MPKKICNAKNCHKIIPGNKVYCEKHEKLKEDNKKINNKIYDEKHRDKKSMMFYHSKEWSIVREQVKNRDNGLCKICLKNKKIKSMDIVHHIEEIKDNYSKRLDIDNCICLCSSCHNTIHGQYDTANKKEIQNELKKMVGEGDY